MRHATPEMIEKAARSWCFDTGPSECRTHCKDATGCGGWEECALIAHNALDAALSVDNRDFESGVSFATQAIRNVASSMPSETTGREACAEILRLLRADGVPDGMGVGDIREVDRHG